MVNERVKKIKLLILDVDGVLTDGKIIYNSKGEELKAFDVQDGFGVTLLHRAGIKSCILTAKNSAPVKRRAKDLRIEKVYGNSPDKLRVYKKILKEFEVSGNQVCFMGDDLIDLPIMKRVGFAVAVPDARNEIKKSCHYITRNPGGKGAVREVAELILKSKALWKSATSLYNK